MLNLGNLASMNDWGPPPSVTVSQPLHLLTFLLPWTCDCYCQIDSKDLFFHHIPFLLDDSDNDGAELWIFFQIFLFPLQ